MSCPSFDNFSLFHSPPPPAAACPPAVPRAAAAWRAAGGGDHRRRRRWSQMVTAVTDGPRWSQVVTVGHRIGEGWVRPLRRPPVYPNPERRDLGVRELELPPCLNRRTQRAASRSAAAPEPELNRNTDFGSEARTAPSTRGTPQSTLSCPLPFGSAFAAFAPPYCLISSRASASARAAAF